MYMHLAQTSFRSSSITTHLVSSTVVVRVFGFLSSFEQECMFNAVVNRSFYSPDVKILLLL